MPPKASPSIREQIVATHLRPGVDCPVCAYIDAHPAEADEVRDVLDDLAVTSMAIYRWLRAQGVKIGRQAVPAHRSGTCGGMRDGRRL